MEVVYLDESSTHAEADRAMQNARHYAKRMGCRSLDMIPVVYSISVDSSLYRMHLSAISVDGKETLLVVGPLISHSRSLQ